MREITPKLTHELQEHCAGKSIWRANAYPVSTFRALVEHVAKLAYENRDELLFFRGQDKDFQSKAGGTTLYPGIYRGDAIPQRELKHRFDLLEQASKALVEKWKYAQMDAYKEVRQKRYVQWSILQHYEVADTPLIDLTHSLRVACSFAQLRSTDPTCYVFVVGLPYVTNRITINSEHDVINIRLLSICPPAALRPYFQEGYLAGTTDVTLEFDSKTELDFRNRLIAKFAIPKGKQFWGRGFDRIPEASLFPRRDIVLDLCSELKSELRYELQSGDLGDFVKEWADLEESILRNARRITERNVSVRNAITILAQRNEIPGTAAEEIHAIRNFRNRTVHQPKSVSPKSIASWLDRLRRVLNEVHLN